MSFNNLIRKSIPHIEILGLNNPLKGNTLCKKTLE